MKISVRGGHCPKVAGASALIDELTEDRKVKDSVIKYLKQLNHEVLDVTHQIQLQHHHPILHTELIKLIIGVLIYSFQFILINAMILIMVL